MNPVNNFPAPFNPREPVQVLQDFLAAHRTDQIQLVLMAALQGYALNEHEGFLKLNVSVEEITTLFDDLVDLVTALEELSAQGKITGNPR